jgi:hypothetical protein
MAAQRKLRPGDAAPSDGFYRVFHQDGSPTEVAYRVEKDKPMPPTFQKNQYFEKVANWTGRGRKAS